MNEVVSRNRYCDKNPQQKCLNVFHAFIFFPHSVHRFDVSPSPRTRRFLLAFHQTRARLRAAKTQIPQDVIGRHGMEHGRATCRPSDMSLRILLVRPPCPNPVGVGTGIILKAKLHLTPGLGLYGNQKWPRTTKGVTFPTL